MNADEIILFVIIALLIILAVILYLLLRRSISKRLLDEQKKIGPHEIINITPEFKFEAGDLNTLDIPSINDIKKTIMDSEAAEIVIDKPKIIESHENEEMIQQKIKVNESPGLRLEDTLIGVENKATGKKIKKKRGRKPKKQKKKTGTKTNPVISKGMNTI